SRAVAPKSPARRDHSQAPTAITRPANRANWTGPKPNSAPRNSAASTRAVRMRCLSTAALQAARGGHLRGLAKAALALVVLLHRPVKGGAVEVGPVHGGEIEFAVGRLPEQEVADALLAGGADAQVRFRQIGGGEVAGEQGLGDVVGAQAAGLHPGGQLAGGGSDLPAPAVVHRQHQGAAAAPGAGLGIGDQLLQALAETGALADHPQADVA